MELSNKTKSDTQLFKLLLFDLLKKINCARVVCLCLLLLDTTCISIVHAIYAVDGRCTSSKLEHINETI